ncbi:glycosyltransferase family 2 protein [Gilvimarinus sp. F26214L]|uniref:glycosyltransferase family 2 protein n=1 Tax=Gilvimarinus sp. DZF01 TaxID=3461371 RepID=UPI004046809F
MLVFAFWLLLFCSLYSYFIYPLLLLVLGRSGKELDAPSDPAFAPRFTLIITAYNEARRIRRKLNNALALNFDKSRLEIIVASDCSDDGTDDIVREFENDGVRLVRAPERLGKEHAQQCAIREASGDIIVFSDVATEMPTDALQKLSRYFSDPEIGAVSSEDRFISASGQVAGEGAYVRYEMWLRQRESRLAGLVGLSGSFFAARRDVCQHWDIHSPSDFNTALNSARLGYRAVTAPDVLGYYPDLKDPTKEYARKIRTVIRGMTSLARHPDVLNPFSYGLFSFQVFSHKLMRWMVPWFLLALVAVNAALINQGVIYQLTLAAQLALYALAAAAHYSSGLRGRGAVRLVYFFVQVNAAILAASCRFLSGTRMTVWNPSAR